MANDDTIQAPLAMSVTMVDEPLVSVVVPAYNAERWIEATLRSLRSQTYRRLEIIVVDDGSSDGTGDVVRRHAARDPRVTLVVQRNQGVAAARNLGMAMAKGDYIAPTDADDLSAPTRIARLVAALGSAGQQVAVAYSWSSLIDEHDRIIAPIRPNFEGDVRQAMYAGNFVANGSAAIMRADALRSVGGYDSTLRDRKAQGCEDWDILLKLAERHEFVRVADFLLGYRQNPGNMSSDRMQMLRSLELVAIRHAAEFPLAKEPLSEARKVVLAEALDYAAAKRRHLLVARLATRMALKSPWWTFRILAQHRRRYWRPDRPDHPPLDTADTPGVARDRFVIGEADAA